MEEYDLKIKAKYFNLKYTLECGQCFRWEKIGNTNEYVGVIEDRVIRIKQIDDKVYIKSSKKEKLKETIVNYFDLNRDYEKIEKEISKIDKNIYAAVNNKSGIRILNQAKFETLISYIISANNNISRISKSVNEISKKYGEEIFFENEKYYLFPTVERLQKVSIDELRKCGVGFRDKYIFEAVKKILEENINLEDYSELKTDKLKEKLLEFKGVGNKVSDCIMLFSYNRGEVFPIDVWVKKVMEKLYFKKNVEIKEIEKYSKENFKSRAGIIQQHLFYNIREGMM